MLFNVKKLCKEFRNKCAADIPEILEERFDIDPDQQELLAKLLLGSAVAGGAASYGLGKVMGLPIDLIKASLVRRLENKSNPEAAKKMYNQTLLGPLKGTLYNRFIRTPDTLLERLSDRFKK
jgi:hypothetical protein